MLYRRRDKPRASRHFRTEGEEASRYTTQNASGSDRSIDQEGLNLVVRVDEAAVKGLGKSKRMIIRRRR